MSLLKTTLLTNCALNHVAQQVGGWWRGGPAREWVDPPFPFRNDDINFTCHKEEGRAGIISPRCPRLTSRLPCPLPPPFPSHRFSWWMCESLLSAPLTEPACKLNQGTRSCQRPAYVYNTPPSSLVAFHLPADITSNPIPPLTHLLPVSSDAYLSCFYSGLVCRRL